MSIKKKKPARHYDDGMPGPELGKATPIEQVMAPCWLYTYPYNWVKIWLINYFPPGVSGDPDGLDERYELVFEREIYDGGEMVSAAIFVPGESVVIRRD